MSSHIKSLFPKEVHVKGYRFRLVVEPVRAANRVFYSHASITCLSRPVGGPRFIWTKLRNLSYFDPFTEGFRRARTGGCLLYIPRLRAP